MEEHRYWQGRKDIGAHFGAEAFDHMRRRLWPQIDQRKKYNAQRHVIQQHLNDLQEAG